MIKKPIKELVNFGIINIDKPSGPTSFQVSDFVRKKLGLNKTSHFGTLDPKVTGVLPIALGRACRLSEYFMHKDKEYVGIMKLHSDISDENLKKATEKYIGKIKQLPPVRSRVKRAVREREVKNFDILERNARDILFLTTVQAGTYIRKLCDDIGKEIGGAHMLELRRTRAGIFSENEENFANLYDFENFVLQWKDGNEKELMKIIVPAEEAIKKVLPVVQINEKKVKQILTGKPLMKEDVISVIKEEKFAAFVKGKFIGVYKSVSEEDILARAEFVFN